MNAPREILRWPTQRSKEWAVRFLHSAWHDSNIVAIVAVGSSVRPHVTSVDLDLVVISRDPQAFKQTAPLEIDLRVYPVALVETKLAEGNDLLGWAVKFGRVLFERDHFWQRVVDRWIDSMPLPSPEIARQRAAVALRRYTKVSAVDDKDAAQEQAVSYATHLARAALLTRGIYPASRPELVGQLRSAGYDALAANVEKILRGEVEALKRLQAHGEGIERDALLNVAADVV